MNTHRRKKIVRHLHYHHSPSYRAAAAPLVPAGWYPNGIFGSKGKLWFAEFGSDNTNKNQPQVAIYSSDGVSSKKTIYNLYSNLTSQTLALPTADHPTAGQGWKAIATESTSIPISWLIQPSDQTSDHVYTFTEASQTSIEVSPWEGPFNRSPDEALPTTIADGGIGAINPTSPAAALAVQLPDVQRPLKDGPNPGVIGAYNAWQAAYYKQPSSSTYDWLFRITPGYKPGVSGVTKITFKFTTASSNTSHPMIVFHEHDATTTYTPSLPSLNDVTIMGNDFLFQPGETNIYKVSTTSFFSYKTKTTVQSTKIIIPSAGGGLTFLTLFTATLANHIGPSPKSPTRVWYPLVFVQMYNLDCGFVYFYPYPALHEDDPTDVCSATPGPTSSLPSCLRGVVAPTPLSFPRMPLATASGSAPIAFIMDYNSQFYGRFTSADKSVTLDFNLGKTAYPQPPSYQAGEFVIATRGTGGSVSLAWTKASSPVSNIWLAGTLNPSGPAGAPIIDPWFYFSRYNGGATGTANDSQLLLMGSVGRGFPTAVLLNAVPLYEPMNKQIQQPCSPKWPYGHCDNVPVEPQDFFGRWLYWQAGAGAKNADLGLTFGSRWDPGEGPLYIVFQQPGSAQPPLLNLPSINFWFAEPGIHPHQAFRGMIAAQYMAAAGETAADWTTIKTSNEPWLPQGFPPCKEEKCVLDDGHSTLGLGHKEATWTVRRQVFPWGTKNAQYNAGAILINGTPMLKSADQGTFDAGTSTLTFWRDWSETGSTPATKPCTGFVILDSPSYPQPIRYDYSCGSISGHQPWSDCKDICLKDVQ